VKEKPVFGSPFFEAFPSDHISKDTKNFSTHFFIRSSNYTRELLLIIQRNSGNFLKLLRTVF